MKGEAEAMKKDAPKPRRRPGRPTARRRNINAMPEEIARKLFSQTKPPDPSLRLPKKHEAYPPSRRGTLWPRALATLLHNSPFWRWQNSTASPV